MTFRREDNKGFTIVELLVAIAIMAVLGGAILSMVMYSSRAYQTSNRSVKLQYEQQLVVTTIKDAILETSRGIWFGKNPEETSDQSLYLIILSDTDESTEPCLAKRFKYEPGDDTVPGKIYMSEARLSDSSITIGRLIQDDIYTDPSTRNALLADTIKDFNVDTSEVVRGRVTFDITFQVGDREISVHPEVALRNILIKLDANIDLKDIYKQEAAVFESKVSSVTILRDGEAFTQNRTDTFRMSGDSTTYDYDAVVTKKRGYSGAFDDSVTWELDMSTVREGYDQVIILNSATGNLTLKNVGHNRAKDFTTSGMIILKAISNQDPSRIARVRIKIDENGVYPVSIKTLNTQGSGNVYDLTTATKDYESGSLIVDFAHEIEYTANIEDPANKGNFVKTLTGAGVFDKITYVSVVDENNLPLTIPGAGFSNSGINRGRFVILSSMEEHTYTITVRVSQRDKDGNFVEDRVKVQAPKGSVPRKVTATKTRLSGNVNADRGGYYGVIADWTNGMPKMRYNDTGEETITPYMVEYEWELDNLNNECGNWDKDDKNSFEQIVKFVNESGLTITDSLGKACSTGEGKNSVRIEVLSYLDWNKTYTFRIKVRAKIEPHGGVINDYMTDYGYIKGGKNYYKYPTDENGYDIFTQNKDEAYVAEIIVTVTPVSVILRPYPGRLDSLGDGIFSTSTNIGLGEKTKITAGGPFLDKITGTNRSQKIIYDYYKVFRAETEGIVFNSTNYRNVVGLGGNTSRYQGIRLLLNNKNSALVPYYYMEGQSGGLKYWYHEKIGDNSITGDDPDDEEGDDASEDGGSSSGSNNTDRVREVPGFTANITAEDEQVYFYLRVTPADWYKKTATFPVGCRFECYLEDKYGNNFKARFATAGTDNTTDYMNYTVYFKYEGEY